ncbi:dihydroxyacetone kinase subunit L [Treponema phagedenis]|uniref:Dihydroxyacetone kinase subunit L n=1 Tax=Treponema phagedenis TaxID=162 RepID=A0A0B7H270_TREPH|nr:dihydroxyacetone kinase subunit DhaL [Treponema phagedenis]NVP24033.1 dihydroxyacetone kinase subunit L [Treponema phagedenis]QEJ96179.1 dihydroxyacetone kinase subunit L [Treponema phagedenis]QEJ99398.1 dihydroxyacetone kinase subunit L [Treponema phagedenis]QEK04969.1 dihydroxyacetone kinase subunit L [Treponema phagedenis]QEK10590.1 dihydroxyacetone kinase subunit L [Treponema phagedenis]
MKPYEILSKVIDVIAENKEYLTELDRAIGDSDHGVNLDRGFQKIKSELTAYENMNLAEMANKIAMTLISNVGGASGALYGTAFMKAGMFLKTQTEINDVVIAEALNQMIAGIKSRGKAERGEKTMLDTLIPVYEFVKAAADKGDSLLDTADEIAEIAKKSMEATKDIKATKGRASYLGERSIGHIDPGAYSSYLIIKTICENIR